MDTKLLISASSPKHAPPPPLLRLPNELLDNIIQLVYTETKYCRLARMPPCHHLLAIQRTYLFRHVELGLYSALASFCRAINSSNGIGEKVCTLHIDLQGEHNRTPSGPSAGGWRGAAVPGLANAVSPPLVTPADFAALLRRVPHVDDVFARDLEAPLLRVLLDEAVSGPLASIRRLVIEGDGPFVPVTWAARLARLPALEDLTLRQYDHAVAVLSNVPLPPTFASLKRLSLLADDCVNPTWAGPALDQMAPYVVNLELEDWYPVAWFASALATAPTELRKLVLKSDGEVADGGAPVPVHAGLARFPHLEHLELCAGAFDPSRQTALHSLLVLVHLRTLVFSYEAATDDFLLSLLQHPHHLPHLVRLDLFYTTSCRGRTVEEMGFLEHGDPEHNAHWPMWDGWEPPEYSPGCSGSVRRAVTQAAQARGIVVVGTALEALGWQTAFDAEQRVAVLWYGDETGDYGPARQVLGDDLVDELLDLGKRAWLESLERDGHVEGGEGGEGGGV
ncbi:hypothetical protein JCM8208_007677 [Rhodotorula glutinis]